ncbi:MAG: cytochrome C, partial [Deltaproteobacteria bacterium]|nr:cytochrome C [Deltaproteobacteria bacterium]
FMKTGVDTCSSQSCHPDQGAFTHPVGEGIIDPRSKFLVTCYTCHNPMGTNNEKLLYFDWEIDLCVQCHQLD